MTSIEPDPLGDYPARGGNPCLSLLGMIFSEPDPLGDLAEGKPSTQTLLGRQLQTWKTITTPLRIW
jgi:hypothetical protein